MQQIQTPAVHQSHQRLRALSGDTQARTEAVQRESALAMEATLLEEKVEAEARGRVAGQLDVLRRQMRTKVVELAAFVEQQLQGAGSAQLTHWTDRILFAETLEQVFSKH